MRHTESAVRRVVMDLISAGTDRRDDLELTMRSPLGSGGVELTSLELIRILVELEEQLGLELDDGAVMNSHFEVVEDIVTLVTLHAAEDRSEPVRE